MLGEITFEQIHENYWFGAYGEFRVVMDKSNGFVNATKLCSSGGKHFYNWSSNTSSKQLMQTLQNLIDASNGEVLDNAHDLSKTPVNASRQFYSGVCKYIETAGRTAADRIISGTYVHPDLVPSVAGWLSPMFQLKANKIVNMCLLEEWKTKLQASEQSALQLLQSLQQSQLDMADKIEQNNELETVIGEWCSVVDFKTEMIQVKEQAIEKLEETVGNQISERQVWASTHSFTLMKLNGESSRYPYYGIRCQSRAVCSAIKKLRRKFPNSEVLYQQRKVPNAINLFSRLKSQKAIEANRNFCNPLCNEKELIHLLSNLCGTQYPASNPAPHNQ
jgi:hypothetical protein